MVAIQRGNLRGLWGSWRSQYDSDAAVVEKWFSPDVRAQGNALGLFHTGYPESSSTLHSSLYS